MTNDKYARALDAARALGEERGRNTATWLFDGNTSRATYETFARWIEDGDPQLWDHCPQPLNGEWADDPTPQGILEDILAGWLSHEDQDDLLNAYAQAFSDGWLAEVERAIRYSTRG